jgi:hypothetical protein
MNKKAVYLIAFAGLLSLASSVFAQITIPNPLKGVDSFGDLLAKIADGVGTVIAALGTIMIIVAGILYLTSAGSPERMTKAKTALVYAIAGIVIGLAAHVIVKVIKEVIGVK